MSMGTSTEEFVLIIFIIINKFKEPENFTFFFENVLEKSGKKNKNR